jgi:hypothetical protein
MNKSAVKTANRKTTLVPITSMEELPVLSEDEKAELLASLKQAQSEMASGDYAEFKQGELNAWLQGEMKDARRRQKHGA